MKFIISFMAVFVGSATAFALSDSSSLIYQLQNDPDAVLSCTFEGPGMGVLEILNYNNQLTAHLPDSQGNSTGQKLVRSEKTSSSVSFVNRSSAIAIQFPITANTQGVFSTVAQINWYGDKFTAQCAYRAEAVTAPDRK